MQNLPERGPSGVTDLELAALDLRYEGYRLRQPRREAALLAAIAQAGIQESPGGHPRHDLIPS
ncbi:MAG: hypothetical protein M5U12_08650 [Verrucomicrobia bacterium]|nr:hypothetical protein [Verrucomicrobiota bacterium]